MNPQDTPKPGRKLVRIAWAGLFAVTAAALCTWSWRHYHTKYSPRRDPVPVFEFIPNVPKDRHEGIMQAIRKSAGFVFTLSPGQLQQLAVLWKDPPRSLPDLISRQKQMDRILTPAQVSNLAPARTAIQNKIVDEMMEPGRKRFRPDEFEKMKNEIKRRVETRMGTPK